MNFPCISLIDVKVGDVIYWTGSRQIYSIVVYASYDADRNFHLRTLNTDGSEGPATTAPRGTFPGMLALVSRSLEPNAEALQQHLIEEGLYSRKRFSVF